MYQSSQISGGLHHQHPLRNIELTYMPGKTELTKEDEKLMKKYIQLHDFEYHLHQKAQELYLSFCKIEPQINTLRQTLEKIKSRLNDSVTMADKLSQNSYVPAETNLEKIQENNAATEAELLSYHQQLNNLFDQVSYNQDILNKCIDSAEDGADKVYEAYSKISYKHSQNYLINTIDIVSIDRDYDKFCSVRDYYEKRRNDFIERSEKIVNNYNELNLETNTLYGVWTEFTKRCQLIQTLSNLHRSNISASIN